MKTYLIGLAAAATLASPLAITSPAAADTPGCVTRAEFKAAKKGMTRAKITSIFDTSGHRVAGATSGGFSTEVRSYRPCPKYAAVALSFDKHGSGAWRMTAKSGVWPI